MESERWECIGCGVGLIRPVSEMMKAKFIYCTCGICNGTGLPKKIGSFSTEKRMVLVRCRHCYQVACVADAEGQDVKVPEIFSGLCTKHTKIVHPEVNEGEVVFNFEHTWAEFCEMRKNQIPKLLLGHIVATPGVLAAVAKNRIDAALRKHFCGDWGELAKEDVLENERSLREGFRILSSYPYGKDDKFWIITEADRSSTTILLPSEY